MTSSDTTSLFSKWKSNEFTLPHDAMKHSSPIRLPQTNPVAFPLLSHTILPYVLYQLSHKDTFKSSRLSHDATASFQTTPLIAFRRTDSLSDILVRAKLRTDKQTSVTKRSFRCGKNSITCRYITDGRTITKYTFSATGEMRTIHFHIDCSSKNTIYNGCIVYLATKSNR